ncbi:MAG: cob(I)yrinic acid a,c-diamide adenosyltransferase [Tannerella sp.]|jgi:cob(I)alamin adenosyltransferase|nr:cob(I)yrinic acid a,c-diamide adenosyltransferase [Tannerella sp.]
MKKSCLYTGGGDRGMTSLAGGKRVSKTHPRLEAYGTVDELNSFTGLLITEIRDDTTIDLLQFIQHKLFAVGSSLAAETGDASPESAGQITPENIRRLEEHIDRIDDKLPKMTGFVLPGGCRSAALAHVCRTVCRRAERQIHHLAIESPVEKNVLIFMNRLSDLLFIIARSECIREKGSEIIWDNACS